MNVSFSDYVKEQLDVLYGDRRLYISDSTYCDSFEPYNKRLWEFVENLKKGDAILSPYGNYYRGFFGFGYADILVNGTDVIIAKFYFTFLPSILRLCHLERTKKGKGLGVRPPNVISTMAPKDYHKIPDQIGYGGTISGNPVYIVQRNESPISRPVFNYLYNGRIISKIDFLSATPFNANDFYNRAYADGANGKRYWIYPTGRVVAKRKVKLRESELRQMIRETLLRFHNFVS